MLYLSERRVIFYAELPSPSLLSTFTPLFSLPLLYPTVGKHAIFTTSAAKEAIKTLRETTDDVLILYTLKLIASITAHPGKSMLDVRYARVNRRIYRGNNPIHHH